MLICMKDIKEHRVSATLLIISFVAVLSMSVSALFAQSQNSTIVAFGDSFIVGVGSTSGNDFVSILSRDINRPITNAGVSGDTTATALARVDNVVSLNPALVLLFVGYNDVLQNVPQSVTMANILSIIDTIQQSGAH